MRRFAGKHLEREGLSLEQARRNGVRLTPAPPAVPRRPVNFGSESRTVPGEVFQQNLRKNKKTDPNQPLLQTGQLSLLGYIESSGPLQSYGVRGKTQAPLRIRVSAACNVP